MADRTEYVNVRVRPEAKATLRELAARLDLSVSDVARLALSKGLTVLLREHKL